MDFELTLHAKKRMRERSITASTIQQALDFPTKESIDTHGNKLLKKLYSKKGKQRLLLLAGKYSSGKFKIFTVIETSKISKYL